MIASFIQRFFSRLNSFPSFSAFIRKSMLVFRGAEIGRNTKIPPCRINWPHQMRLGDDCVLEENISFIYFDAWKPGFAFQIGDRSFIGRYCEFNCCGSITIGKDVLIASGCKFIDHNHGFALGFPINKQPNEIAPIVLEDDVWLGVNVVVLKGVTIGYGAIVGAGAVVTKSIPANEIWGGVPAKKIGVRQDKTL